MEFTVLTIPPTDLGEGPFWDAQCGRLGLVDLVNGRLMVVDKDGHPEIDLMIDGELSLAVPIEGHPNSWLVAAGNRVGVLTDDGMFSTIAETSDDPKVRLNDGKCDRRGRLWVGSMSRSLEVGRGALYRVDTSGAVTTMADELTLSNGMGWSPDGRTFYLIDTIPGELIAWDFDEEVGMISNRRVVNSDMGPGMPDGLDIDENGDIWVAICGGGIVKQFSGAGRWLADHPTPVTLPTCPVFGGNDRRTLYVTSARVTLSEDQLDAEPAGMVLAARTETAGLAAYRAVVDNSYLGAD